MKRYKVFHGGALNFIPIIAKTTERRKIKAFKIISSYDPNQESACDLLESPILVPKINLSCYKG